MGKRAKVVAACAPEVENGRRPARGENKNVHKTNTTKHAKQNKNRHYNSNQAGVPINTSSQQRQCAAVRFRALPSLIS